LPDPTARVTIDAGLPMGIVAVVRLMISAKLS